ncbi:MAG TPA: hypothetical protein PKD00_11480, partial [Burkholderiales bacterium]|nr:hypothetical protein [Burkholderiales bacterium]
MYSCSGAECVADENGIYDHPSCYGNCNVGPTMYSCAEAECVEDENGIYNNSNCDWACVPPQLLGFIELDDIANTPVPGNSVGDWNTFVNQGATQWSAEFTSVVVDVNKIEFYGVPQLNERLVLYPLVGTLNIVDYDFTGFEYVKELELVNVSGLSLFSFTSFPELVKSRTVYTDIVTYTFTSCINLEKIVIESSTVTTLDISTCSLLEEFYVVNCPLPDLDFSNNPLLFDITFRQCTGAVNVDLTANLALTNLEASGDFTALDVSNNTLLTSLGVSAPNLLALDIDNLTVLTSLNIEGCTSVTTLDTSNNLLLITARIGLSGLLTYDPSSNTAFEQLWINDTVISTLDVSYNIALYYLNIRECPITTIDISANTLLSTFDAGYSDLTTADITDSVS